jgi:hypothetical protein
MPCCCGTFALTPLPLQAAVAPPPARSDPTTARLRYVGAAALTLRGPFSGRVYELAASAPELTPEPTDLAALLRTGLFEAL